MQCTVSIIKSVRKYVMRHGSCGHVYIGIGIYQNHAINNVEHDNGKCCMRCGETELRSRGLTVLTRFNAYPGLVSRHGNLLRIDVGAVDVIRHDQQSTVRAIGVWTIYRPDVGELLID